VGGKDEIRAEWQRWQERTLDALLWISAVVTAAVAVFQLLVANAAPYGVFFLGLSVGTVVAAFARRAGYAFRAAVLICAYQAGGLYGLVVLGGAANTLSAMYVAVVFATLFLGRTWGIATAALATGATLLVAVLFRAHALKPMVGFDPADGLTLIRVGLSFGALATTIVIALAYLLSRAESLVVEKMAMVTTLEREQADNARMSEELRHHDEELRKARELEILGRLAGCVAHDFNNALLIIQGSADIARRDPGQVDMALREIDEAVRQATATTRQLRAFGPQASRPPMRLSMGESVARACNLLGRILPKNIAVEVETDDAPLVRADEGQIQRIVTNLVLNARDAMPEGGRLQVRVRAARDGEAGGARTDGGFAAVEVRDDGVGMSRETMAHVFEPFFTTKGPGGTGLGLASVRSLIEDAGGCIRVESAPGAGTAFTFYWPLVEPDAEASAPVDRSVVARKGRVLVVDDDAAARRTMVRVLESEGHEVLEAATGSDALTLVSHGEAIDVLCSDCVMPGIPLGQLVEGFRAACPGARVLLCSGYAPDDRLPPPRMLDAFLPKPFSAEALSSVVGQLLDGRS
jgi:signal transduction histidine kinase